MEDRSHVYLVCEDDARRSFRWVLHGFAWFYDLRRFSPSFPEDFLRLHEAAEVHDPHWEARLLPFGIKTHEEKRRFAQVLHVGYNVASLPVGFNYLDPHCRWLFFTWLASFKSFQCMAEASTVVRSCGRSGCREA